MTHTQFNELMVKMNKATANQKVAVTQIQGQPFKTYAPADHVVVGFSLTLLDGATATLGGVDIAEAPATGRISHSITLPFPMHFNETDTLIITGVGDGAIFSRAK